jgi:hypothetical protein
LNHGKDRLGFEALLFVSINKKTKKHEPGQILRSCSAPEVSSVTPTPNKVNNTSRNSISMIGNNLVTIKE